MIYPTQFAQEAQEDAAMLSKGRIQAIRFLCDYAFICCDKLPAYEEGENVGGRDEVMLMKCFTKGRLYEY